jgi:hypothetical protein
MVVRMLRHRHSSTALPERKRNSEVMYAVVQYFCLSQDTTGKVVMHSRAITLESMYIKLYLLIKHSVIFEICIK